MKKLSVKSIAVVLLATLFGSLYACAAKEKYTLEYNVKQGDTFQQNMMVDMKISQEMSGMAMEIVNVMEIETSYDILSVENDLITTEFVFEKMKMSMGVAGNTMELTSETEDDVASVTNLNALLKSITNVPVVMTMTKKGKVQSVQNFDKLTDSMINSFGEETDAALREQIAAQFAQQFNDEATKAMFEQSSTYFPEEEVAVGDKWQIVQNLQGQFEMSVVMDMTLKEVKNNIATLEGKGVIKTPKEGITQEDITMQMDGKQTAVIKIDMNTGWVVDGNIKQEMNMVSETGGVKIPQKITSNVSITN